MGAAWAFFGSTGGWVIVRPMIADSTLRLPSPSRPVSFGGLMALYESNYVRLGWLIPDLRHIESPQQSAVSNDPTLHLDVLERTRWTTTLRLTYFFDSDRGIQADPDLTVRIYHDADLAEAMACTRQHRHRVLRAWDTRPGIELERRWARNSMLNKWLEYCAENGHRFESTVSGNC